jgi:hypothetical protein
LLYIGHFSFSFESKAKRQAAQPWHGYFTAVVEAPHVSAALRKLEALVVKSAASSELFDDMSTIFLESCVELKSVPRAGFLAHVALEEGSSLGSISVTLPAVNRKHATTYHLEPDSADDDGGFDAEPFVVLPKKKPAAATKKNSKTSKPAAQKG